MIILEAGINHFGKLRLAKKILNFFLNSSFSHLTFMIHTENFYNQFKKKNINFYLPKNFYLKALEQAHKKNKKIGLAVCDEKSFFFFKEINFDFYKLLSIAITNKKVINILNKKKKEVYVSLGKGTKENIKKCINFFKLKKKVKLIYTSMSYSENDINLERISELRNLFSLKIGYGHHHNNPLPLFLSSYFNPSFYFIYLKPEYKKGRVYPDDNHAFFLNELETIKKNITISEKIIRKKKAKIKIKLDAKKIHL